VRQLKLAFSALLITYPLVAMGESARLAAEIVVRNTSGKLQENVELGIRTAIDIKDLQILDSLRLDNRTDNSHSIGVTNGYAQVVAGDFLPGESKIFTVLQSVHTQKPVEILERMDMETSLHYAGYQSRANTTSGLLRGDCSEAAIAARNTLRERGEKAEMVSGFVVSTNRNTGQRLVTHHDWVWQEERNLFIDPSADLLPGVDHQYVALGLVLSEGARFPMYISNQEGIEVSLTFK